MKKNHGKHGFHGKIFLFGVSVFSVHSVVPNQSTNLFISI